MTVRPYRASDAAFVARIHAERGFPCETPDLGKWEAVLVGVDDADQPVAIVGAQKTVEIVMWADPEWSTPGVRLEMLRDTHAAMQKELDSRGYRSAHAWLAPAVAKAFGRRLRKMFGWQRSPWESWEKGW